jgi:hypothetical protein
MTAANNDYPENIKFSSNPILGPLYPPGVVPVKDVFEDMMTKVRLHLKTHKQGKVLYWINGKYWIRCYTHRRLEPATWLV